MAHNSVKVGKKRPLVKQNERRDNNDASLDVFCNNQINPCLERIVVGSLNGLEVRFCAKVLRRLEKNESITVKVQKNTSQDIELITDKELDDLGCGVKETINLFKKKKPSNIDKVLLKDIGISMTAQIIENSEQITEKDIDKLKYPVVNRFNRMHGKVSSRPVTSQRKVGDYVYLQQMSDYGKLHWYLQQTKGKKQKFYLGAKEPTFIPETDLENLRLRKEEKRKK